MVVTSVRLVRAGPALASTGLLGFASFQVDSILVDGVAIRRTRCGRLTLTFPARRDSRGREHPYLRPACERARREIESAVLAAIKEPLQLLCAPPGRAHIDAAAADEQTEEGRPRGHRAQGTGGGRTQ